MTPEQNSLMWKWFNALTERDDGNSRVGRLKARAQFLSPLGEALRMIDIRHQHHSLRDEPSLKLVLAAAEALAVCDVPLTAVHAVKALQDREVSGET